jgi:phosphoserine phosphatase
MLCNDAVLRRGEDTDRAWAAVGDPTEAALLAAGGKFGLDQADLTARWPRVAELPFDSNRKRMSTVHHLPDDRVRVVCKGAPEAVLQPTVLTTDPATIARAMARAEELAGHGHRVLAVAQADRDTVPPDSDMEQGLQLLGLIALTDPPRRSAATTIAACQAAGIALVMITGDHPATARAIAHELGIISPDGLVVDCRELQAPDDPRLRTARVFARATPEQKLDIIQARRDAGDVVAMTGDGVNDGPALHRADIGVAMGRRGTEVARQAADLVLADDELATVVAAAEEGRRVYANIRRFLLYGLSGGTAEILVMLAGPLVGLALPLLPAQILWVNLLTHGLPGGGPRKRTGRPEGHDTPAPATRRKRPGRRAVAAHPARRRRHRRRHPRHRGLGPRHRSAVADHGLLRPRRHPTRRRPRFPCPARKSGQPDVAGRRRRRPGPAIRRRVPAAAAAPARHRAPHPARPSRRLRRRHRRLCSGPPRPRRPPDQTPAAGGDASR